MAENGAFSRPKSAILPCLEPEFLNRCRRFDCFYVGRPFWRPRSKENVGRHFRARTFFDVTRHGRVRPDAMDLMTCGRHGDAARTATLPRRGMYFYLA